ncbi:uncharacterized protein LOC119765065 [Culex quinquefasciatus]|nr:uncharacterized protein LOC119765065 [Culex quinquefasciatus]
MKESYFRYKGKFYYQIYGTAMGSPLSPILADISLETVIGKAVEALPFDVPIVRKYVDDLFIAVPADKIDVVLEEFNKHEARLQFTLECEQDNKLPFLDMQVIRNADQTLSTDWYAKPIASGRMLNYNSFHQMKHKVNVANNFIHRVTTLSTHSSWNDQKQIIYTHLHNNGYPRTLISRLIQQHQSKTLPNASEQPNVATLVANTNQDPTQPPTLSQPQPEADAIYRSIPYVPKLTERLQKVFRSDYNQIRIASRQTNTVNNLHTKVKDPKNHHENSNVIYKIPCNSCNKCYIGMTKNKLSTRLSGHRSDVNKLEKIVTDHTNTETDMDSIRDKTALLEHCVNTGHRFQIDNTKIVDTTFMSHTLPFLEMCHIFNTQHTVNHRVDVDGLNTAYASVLHSIRPQHTDTHQIRPHNLTQSVPDENDTP